MAWLCTILIVDDEPLGRATLEGLLAGHGYRLAFAANGPDALAQAAHLTPDLILLDIMLPGMDGLEVCRRLRADRRIAEVPIILITALDDRDARMAGFEAGADDFVSKPFDRAELRARVRTVTQLNRYRRLLVERERFDWVVEHAEDGYLMLSERDEVLYANPQARRWLGLAWEDAAPVAERFLALARQQYRCEPEAAWGGWPDQAVAAVSVPRYLVRPTSQIAGALWLQVELRGMPAAASKQYLVRLHDMTATVVEQRAMWTFNTFVSHKLRTPLNGLTGLLEILDHGFWELADEQKKELLESARESALRLQDQLLAVFQYIDTREGAGVGRGTCSLAAIAAIVIEVSERLELSSTLQYDEIDDPAATYVGVSQQAIELIVWELLDNAKKFHPAQRPRLEIIMRRTAESIRFQMSDDGVTLPPEQVARLALPYYQAERDFTGEVGGMGLGLAMVAAVLWTAGGEFRISNRMTGPGLVVEIRAPLVHGPRPSGR